MLKLGEIAPAGDGGQVADGGLHDFRRNSLAGEYKQMSILNSIINIIKCWTISTLLNPTTNFLIHPRKSKAFNSRRRLRPFRKSVRTSASKSEKNKLRSNSSASACGSNQNNASPAKM